MVARLLTLFASLTAFLAGIFWAIRQNHIHTFRTFDLNFYSFSHQSKFKIATEWLNRAEGLRLGSVYSTFAFIYAFFGTAMFSISLIAYILSSIYCASVVYISIFWLLLFWFSLKIILVSGIVLILFLISGVVHSWFLTDGLITLFTISGGIFLSFSVFSVIFPNIEHWNRSLWKKFLWFEEISWKFGGSPPLRIFHHIIPWDEIQKLRDNEFCYYLKGIPSYKHLQRLSGYSKDREIQKIWPPLPVKKSI